jgi:hypothetical protein
MGFEFISDQPEQKLVDNKTTLSVNSTEENLTQAVFAEGEEEQLAIQFIEETGLYTKFLLYCGIQEQLKNLKLSVATPNE